METVMIWLGPTLDVMTVLMVAAAVWRLGRDPGAAWQAHEERLQTIFTELRALVAQSEGLARDLDGKLAAREASFQRLVAEARTALAERRAPVEPAAAVGDDPALVAGRIEALAESGATVEDIARRLGVAPAEVRLVIGLKTARVARQRAAAEPRTHAH